MNCVNHPEVTAVAYCQNCGKAVCTDCLRSVSGVIYCEPCLAARVASTGPVPTGMPGPPIPAMHANPVLAGLLGFIPGVGAMYNGQYVKALAHVLIFAVFVSLSDKSFVFGLLVSAWVFYQVFDAAQTAKARHDGLPLPNPFGLNDLGTRLGMAPTPPAPPFVPPYAAGTPPPPPSPTGQGFGSPGFGAAGFSSADFSSQGSGLGPPPPPPGNPPVYPPVYAPAPPDPARSRSPVGAIVLIAIGVVLLLQTLGVLEQEWISRTWPVIIIGFGGWLLYRRTRETPRGGGL